MNSSRRSRRTASSSAILRSATASLHWRRRRVRPGAIATARRPAELGVEDEERDRHRRHHRRAASAIFALRSWSGPSAIACWYWVGDGGVPERRPVFGSRYRSRRLTSLSSELALAANSAAVPRSTTATEARRDGRDVVAVPSAVLRLRRAARMLGVAGPCRGPRRGGGRRGRGERRRRWVAPNSPGVSSGGGVAAGAGAAGGAAVGASRARRCSMSARSAASGASRR